VKENTPPNLRNQTSTLGPIFKQVHEDVLWTPTFFGLD
jgi:hypothetical protein